MVCPSCSSNDLRKLSLIYLAGTYDAKGTSRGIIFGPTGLNAYRGRHRSTQQTKLSKSLEPPRKRRLLKPLLYGVVGAFCLPFVRISHQAWNTLFIGYCAVVVLYLAGALLYNLVRFPEALRRWQSSFLCQRCGAVIEPQAPAASHA